MAVQDTMHRKLHDLLSTVEKAGREIKEALNDYGKHYLERVSIERSETLEALCLLLYEENRECLKEDFRRAMLPEAETSRLGKHDRLICLTFLLRGVQCYLGEEPDETVRFANELATGKYSMEDLPY